mmetsp:Transcript_132359/g.411443  ORF Transcript_132359/g.411443 Transcript_132359/m.411443 type:complete len:646 (+) Transcript_132359:765-2702(+)
MGDHDLVAAGRRPPEPPVLHCHAGRRALGRALGGARRRQVGGREDPARRQRLAAHAVRADHRAPQLPGRCRLGLRSDAGDAECLHAVALEGHALHPARADRQVLRQAACRTPHQPLVLRHAQGRRRHPGELDHPARLRHRVRRDGELHPAGRAAEDRPGVPAGLRLEPLLHLRLPGHHRPARLPLEVRALQRAGPAGHRADELRLHPREQHVRRLHAAIQPLLPLHHQVPVSHLPRLCDLGAVEGVPLLQRPHRHLCGRGPLCRGAPRHPRHHHRAAVRADGRVRGPLRGLHDVPEHHQLAAAAHKVLRSPPGGARAAGRGRRGPPALADPSLRAPAAGGPDRGRPRGGGRGARGAPAHPGLPQGRCPAAAVLGARPQPGARRGPDAPGPGPREQGSPRVRLGVRHRGREQRQQAGGPDGTGALQPRLYRLDRPLAQQVQPGHARADREPHRRLQHREERAPRHQRRHPALLQDGLRGQDGLRQVHDHAHAPAPARAPRRPHPPRGPRLLEHGPHVAAVDRGPRAPGPDDLRGHDPQQHRPFPGVPGRQDLGVPPEHAAPALGARPGRRHQRQRGQRGRQHELRPEAAPQHGADGHPAAPDLAAGRVHLGPRPEHPAGGADHRPQRVPPDHGDRHRAPRGDHPGL